MKNCVKIFPIFLVFVLFFVGVKKVYSADAVECCPGCFATTASYCYQCNCEDDFSNPLGDINPCYNVSCKLHVIEGDSCICLAQPADCSTEELMKICERNGSIDNQCGEYACPTGTYCGRTNTGDDLCIPYGDAQKGKSLSGCDESDETCDVSQYCEDAGFSSTETDFELGGVAECPGQVVCKEVTLALACYEVVPSNTRLIRLSMGSTSDIREHQTTTTEQTRKNFTPISKLETAASIVDSAKNSSTLSSKELPQETKNAFSWVKDIINNVFADSYVTTTELGYSKDNASGLEINNPTHVVATYTDDDGPDDLEGIFYWFTAEGTNPVKTPRYIDEDGTTADAQTVTAEDFGFMVRRIGNNWNGSAEIYVPAITTAGNYWVKAGIFSDISSSFYIYGPNGLRMVRITNMTMSVPGDLTDSITLNFDIEFLNENSGIETYEKVNDGEYDVLAMAIDTYSFSTWDQYTITDQETDGIGINPDTVRTYFSENSIRDYREWTDTGLNWFVDLTPPDIAYFMLNTESYVGENEEIQTNLKLNWKADDTGTGVAYIVKNLFTEYYGQDPNSYIDWENNVVYGVESSTDDISNYLVPSFAENLIGQVNGSANIWEKDWRDSAKGVQRYYGIVHGLQDSSLTFLEDRFNSADNKGEIDIICGSNDNNCWIYTVDGKMIYTPSISGGVAIADDATGEGFVMYSPVSLSTRGIVSTNKYNSRSYIAVRYEEDEGGWQYNNDIEWVNFTPIQGDILVADVNFADPDNSNNVTVTREAFQNINVFGNDTIDITNSSGGLLSAYLTVFDQAGNFNVVNDTYNTDAWLITRGGAVFSEEGTNISISLLNLMSREYEGITRGLKNSTLIFWSNRLNRRDNAGEIDIECSNDYCEIYTLDGEKIEGSEASLTGVGVPIYDNATGDGFIMYSKKFLGSRDVPMTIVGYSNVRNFVAVRYDENEGWQYNNDRNWINFNPEPGDILVAAVSFDPLGVSKIESEGDGGLFSDDDDPIFGVQSSNIAIVIGMYNGLYNVCEMDVRCEGGDDNCYITTTEGVTYTGFDVGGITLVGENSAYCSGASGTTYSEYIMFSTASLKNERGFDIRSNASDNFYVAHYFISSETWMYNDNDRWISFKPIRGIDYIIGQTKTLGLRYVQLFQTVTGDSWPGDLWYSPSTRTVTGKQIFDSAVVDVSTEILAGNVGTEEELYKLIHSTPIQEGGIHNESSLVLNNAGILKNSAYITYSAKARTQADKIGAYIYTTSNDRTFTGASSDYCTVGELAYDYCIVDSEFDITIESGFVCDRKTLFMTSEDIYIDPDVTNADGTSACLFLAGGDITVDEGTYASDGESEPKYDVLEGFLMADGTINIDYADAGLSVKDGLQINGGLVGFGGKTKSIVITRDMKLADKRMYPIVAVMADSRYGKTALKFFGAEINIYKQEVGYKPY